MRPNANADNWKQVKDQERVFSVKSTKTLIQDQPPGEQDITFKWNSWNPIKVNIFGWRATKGRLPTRNDLGIRGL